MTRKLLGSVKSFAFNALDALPVIVPTVVALFGVVAIIFLLLDRFELLPIMLCALPLCMLATVYLYKREKESQKIKKGSSAEKRFVSILLITGVFVWVGFNSFYNAQHVYTNRDPGVYAVTGAWLVKNKSLRIPLFEDFAKLKGAQSTSAGFSTSTFNKKEIYAQGTHILPAFLGMFGRLVGQYRMYPLNVVFGGTALLALYAFARLLVKPRWAFVSVLALGASLPLLYFSRDSYTEPLALTFMFGSLALLTSAYKTKKGGLWFLGGITLGAGVMTRIDAYMAVAFVIPFLVVFLASSRKSERLRNLRNIGLFAVGLGFTGVIGYLDVKHLSSGYFRDTWSLIRQEFLLITGLSLLGIITVVLAWCTRFFSHIDRIGKKWRVLVCVGLVTVTFTALAVRPVVYDEHKNQTTTQTSGERKVERVRTYKEEAIYWVAWYIGPLTMLLGAIGLLVMIYKIIEERDDDTFMYILLVSLTICTSLIYFIKPSIATDQIWASRRMLPVIMPGYIIASVFTLELMYKNKLKVLEHLKINGVVVSSVLATLVVISPLVVSIPFIDHAPFTQLAGIKGTCEALPSNSVVLWVGIAKHEAPLTTRAFCNVPSLGVKEQWASLSGESRQEILSNYALAAKKAGRIPILGAFDSNLNIDEERDKYLSVVANGSYKNIEYVRGRPPRAITSAERYIRLGVVDTNGSLSPL